MNREDMESLTAPILDAFRGSLIDAMRARTDADGFGVEDGAIVLDEDLSRREYDGDPFVFDAIFDAGGRL